MASPSPIGSPPMMPSFSLRVQLYSSDAYGPDDRPVQCFRVVTSPHVTIRDFCEEASRIHEMNYGRPISIKKCQDDQLYDLTQSEVLGAIFTSTATIRVVQASAAANIRDSVPPDSALRYDPRSNKRKRNKGNTVQVNGTQSPRPAANSNKRQKLSDAGPDKPLPSSERDPHGIENGGNTSSIPDSPPSAGRSVSTKGKSSETKTTTGSGKRAPATVAQGKPSKTKTSATAPAKTKSANQPTEKSTERGTPVSTATKSSLSADQHPPSQDQSARTTASELLGTVNAAKANGGPKTKRSTTQEVIDLESQSANSSTSKENKKSSVKEKKSPTNGVSPENRTKKLNTPPSGNDTDSRNGDQDVIPKHPLTSDSRLKGTGEEPGTAEKGRKAAAEAMEQRSQEVSAQKKREADQTKAAEPEPQKKAEREKPTGLSLLQGLEEKKRVEKLKSQEARDKQLAEDEHIEQAKRKRSEENAERAEKKKKNGQKGERSRKEKKAAAADAEETRQGGDSGKESLEVTSAEEPGKSKEKGRAESKTPKRKLSSASVESSQSAGHPGQSSTPKPPSAPPIPIKSALKSSQASMGSSPAHRLSSSAVTSSQAMANDVRRRVSFNLDGSLPKIDAEPNRLPTKVLPQKQSYSPIPPPVGIFSKKPVSSPLAPPKKSASAITPPASITPKVVVKGPSPTPDVATKNDALSYSTTKGSSQVAKSAPVLDSVEDDSSSDSSSQEDAPGGLSSTNRQGTASPKFGALAPKSKIGDHGEESALESGQSTPPDTRSPVVFNHNPPTLGSIPPLELSNIGDEAEDEAEAQSDVRLSSEEDSDDDDESRDDGDEDEEMVDAEQVPTPRASHTFRSSASGEKIKQGGSQASSSLSDRESMMQDAIDDQLTSSIYEAQTSSPSRPPQSQNKQRRPPNATETQRPKFKVGASLNALNAAKDVLGRGEMTTPKAVGDNSSPRPVHRSLKSPAWAEESDSESDSDSGDDSDSESEGEEASSKALAAQLLQAQSVPLPDSDEDSDSNDDSEEEYRQSIRDELKADLDRMSRKTADIADNMSSSRPPATQIKSRIAGRDIVKEEKKKRDSKYMNGYAFSPLK